MRADFPRASLPGAGLFRVGGWPWLVRHELRLKWRDLTARTGTRALLLWGAGGLVAAHVALWFLTRELRGTPLLAGPPSGPVLLLATLALLFFGGVMLSQAISDSVATLFDRGDLDLLVSSPLSSRVIFTGRALGVAAGAMLSVLVFFVPIGSAGLLLGVPRLLGVYPSLLALGLGTTSLAMLLTLGLVRLIGARRTRTAAQIIGSLAGAAVFLASQAPNLLGGGAGSAPVGWLSPLLPLLEPGAVLGPASPLWLPARAVFLDPAAVLLNLGASAGLFWLAVSLAHRTYLSGTRESGESAVRPRPDPGRPVSFRGGLAAVVLLKEWRLIWRDPYLISQTLLQLLYLLPTAFLLLRPGRGGGLGAGLVSPASVMTLVSVMVGGTLAANLTRICVSGEDAPDLLAAAPVGGPRLRGLKLAAGVIPVWLLFLPLLAAAALRGLPGWLPAGACLLGSSLSLAALQVWSPTPLTRADLFRNRRGGDLVTNLLSLLVTLGWLAAGAGQAGGAWWGPPGRGVGLAGAAAAYARSRLRPSALGY